MILAYANAICAAGNVAAYMGLGQHWYNAATAVLSGLLAIIEATRSAA